MTEMKMYTIAEASKSFGVTEYALRKWVRGGTLPSVKIGKKYMLNEQVLEKFLQGESLNAPAQNDSVCQIKPISVRGVING